MSQSLYSSQPLSGQRFYNIVSPSPLNNSPSVSPMLGADTRLTTDHHYSRVSPMVQPMMPPMVQPIVQPMVQSVTQQMPSVISNEISSFDGMSDDELEPSIHELEEVIKDAIDYIEECFVTEEKLMSELDYVVKESRQLKMTTEFEAKQFCTQMKIFSDFVKNIEKKDDN